MNRTMTHAVATAALAPVLREANVRAEQVTQLVLGETATVLEAAAEWLHVRHDDDAYPGWVHRGYVRELERAAATAWRDRALGWSMGALVRVERAVARLPLRARVAVSGSGVELPDGRWGAVFEGGVPTVDHVQEEARRLRPDAWAWQWFAGTHYLWGGVTPLGVDCSGLVQTAFFARGVSLPRDAWQQASSGREVPLAEARPGDLLFFHGERRDRITHVAFLSEDDHLVHATLACGGVVREPWGPGSRAATALRERLVTVRRVETPAA